MPISATGPRIRRTAERGLTLVELLLALAIAGLAASAVLITLPPGRESLDAAGASLAAKLRFAANLAVLRGETVGADVTVDGYRFYRLQARGWQLIEQDSPLAPSSWQEPMRVELRQHGLPLSITREEARQPDPRLRFEPIGLATAFTLHLSRDQHRLTIRGDTAGEVVLEAGND